MGENENVKESVCIELRPRTKENVSVYFYKVQDEEIKKFLPQKAKNVEEAIEDFEKSQGPDSTSYGRSIYADGTYVGDFWVYCMGEEEPDAMLSFCLFEKSLWGKGVTTEAAKLFLSEIKEKFNLKTVGAFTYSEILRPVRFCKRTDFWKKKPFGRTESSQNIFKRIFRKI